MERQTKSSIDNQLLLCTEVTGADHGNIFVKSFSIAQAARRFPGQYTYLILCEDLVRFLVGMLSPELRAEPQCRSPAAH
jgi:hypothetical protein